MPGVPGIGVKTAAELIKEYGDLDALLARAGEIKQPKRREKLIEFADQARVSRELVRLKDDVPDMRSRSSARRARSRPPDAARLPARDGILDADQAHRRGPGRRAAGAGRRVASAPPVPTQGSRGAPGSKRLRASRSFRQSPAAGAAEAAAAAKAPFDRSKYETVVTREHLEAWIVKAYAAGRVAFDTETTRLDPMAAELVGFSMAVAPGKACYVPLGHRASRTASTSATHDGIVQVPCARRWRC